MSAGRGAEAASCASIACALPSIHVVSAATTSAAPCALALAVSMVVPKACQHRNRNTAQMIATSATAIAMTIVAGVQRVPFSRAAGTGSDVPPI